MSMKRRTRVGRDNNGGCGTERGHRRPERDNELSCGSCRSQTGSPDDTSVGLTHPDSLICPLKTCMEQQTDEAEGKDNTHRHTHTHSGITWCIQSVSGLY